MKSDTTSTNLVRWTPKFENSKNHDDTLAVLEKALDSDLFSIVVRNFITANRDKIYSSLCFIDINVLIPEGISLGTKGPLPDLNQKSGIYCITCESTGEKYIGSAINLFLDPGGIKKKHVYVVTGILGNQKNGKLQT